MRRIRISYIITGLTTGGAETALCRLLSRTDRSRFEPEVISLMACCGRPLERAVEELGIPLHSLALRPGRPRPAALVRLVAHLRRSTPDVLSGWEVHGNLAAWAGSWLLGIPAVWNVRGSLDCPDSERFRTRVWIRTLAALSGKAARIVYNSERSREQHEAAGYLDRAGMVIPNGFDTELFRPDAGARLRMRQEWGIREDEFVVGMTARFHPVKNHRGLLAAVRCALDRGVRVRVILAGTGVEARNQKLREWIDASGLTRAVVLLGERRDMPQVLNGLDAFCLSSVAEAFPNAVGEAMAVELPVIVTDVGDAARIVGDHGWVVPAGDPTALGEAMVEAARIPKRELIEMGRAARVRIETEFELDRIAGRFDQVHGEAASQAARLRRPADRRVVA